MGVQPDAIAITPNGKTAYVAENGANADDPSFPPGMVTPITIATNTAGAPITVGNQPNAIAITPNGRTIYVTSFGHGTITPISPGTNRAGKSFFVGSQLTGIVMSPRVRVPTTTVSKLRIYPHAVSIAGQMDQGRCVKPTSGASGAQSCRRAFKARIGYSLNVATTVTITVEQLSSGRLAGGECVTPTEQNLSDTHCTRRTSVPGAITQTATRNGHQKYIFNGQIGGNTLGAGSYLVTVTPSGGAPQSATFQIAT